MAGETFSPYGETLEKRIERGPLPVADALDIAIQVGEALSRAHQAGVVHRDVKPANIMLTPDGLVKIVDFGVAKLTGQSDVIRTGGTVAYMSPEQIAGEEVDQRTDVWALGVVLFEMLIGQRPFTGQDDLAVGHSIRNRQPPRMGHLRGEIPSTLAAIVTRALAKNRRARYESAAEITRDLKAVRVAAIDAHASVASAMPRSERRHPLGAAAIVVLMALAGLALVAFYVSCAPA